VSADLSLTLKFLISSNLRSGRTLAKIPLFRNYFNARKTW